jgi:hypothetical protein
MESLIFHYQKQKVVNNHFKQKQMMNLHVGQRMLEKLNELHLNIMERIRILGGI